MRVRLLRPWQFRRVGQVLDLADGVAELLIHSGKAQRLDGNESPAESPQALVPPLPQRAPAAATRGRYPKKPAQAL